MPKKTVKRCVRPQCMEIYEETEKNRFCMCGAMLQTVEIEIKPKKNAYKKPMNLSKPKVNLTSKTEENSKPVSEEAVVNEKNLIVPEEETEIVDNQSEQASSEVFEADIVQDDEKVDFFGDDEGDDAEEEKSADEDDTSETKAFLYLLLEDDDVEFELCNITRIGRAADGVQVDIDLSEYAGKDVSREHAVIRKEKDGYYITNVSRNHSVRIMDQDDNEVALEYGKKALLKSEDGIILSRKVLLQFVEEE